MKLELKNKTAKFDMLKDFWIIRSQDMEVGLDFLLLTLQLIFRINKANVCTALVGDSRFMNACNNSNWKMKLIVYAVYFCTIHINGMYPDFQTRSKHPFR